MGGGGGPPDTSTTTSQATLPPELRPLFKALAGNLTGLLPSMTNIASAATGEQAQAIAGITGEEKQWRDQMLSMLGAQGGLTGAQREARQGLRQFTTGEIGQSRATQEAMNLFKTQQLPSILQGSAVSGLGQGAIAEAAAQATQAAYVPLIQQEEQNRLAAYGQLGNLGAQGYAQKLGLQGVAGMEREIQDRIGQAKYNELLRRQGLAQNFLLGPFGKLAQPGQTSSTVNTGGGK